MVITTSLPVCIVALLLALSATSSNGRKLVVSQGTFGGSLGRLIASTDASLTKEMETLKAESQSCQSTMATKASGCESCLKSKHLTQICTGISWISGIYQTFSAKVTPLVLAAGSGIKSARTVLGGAGKAIYKKYGEKAINALKDGFNKYGGRTVVNAIQNGVNKAKKVAKTVANKVVNVAKSMLHCDKTKMSRDVRKPVFGVSDQAPHKPGCTATEDEIFSGWRKKRSMMDVCLNRCPDCRDPGCGTSIETKIAALKTRANKYLKLVEEWDSTSDANRDLLKEIWINDSTNKISKIVVWKDSAWRNYHPSGIAVNPYNVDPMYDAIALYVMNLY